MKTKVALNLTKRQLACFGLGGLAGIPVYFLTRDSLGNETAALLMVSLMLPFFAFGIYEKDGLPLEKVLWNFISASFLRPPCRPYRTDNGYAALVRQAETDKEAEQIEKRKTGRAGKDPAGRKKAGGKGKSQTGGSPAAAGQETDRAGKETPGRRRGEGKA